MHAQITWFDGPRSGDLVAAAEFAGRNRITPAVMADAECAAGHVAVFVLRAPDGGEMVIVVAESEDVLDRAGEVIMNTELLPGEDPALLPGPDRVTRHRVVHAIDHGKVLL